LAIIVCRHKSYDLGNSPFAWVAEPWLPCAGPALYERNQKCTEHAYEGEQRPSWCCDTKAARVGSWRSSGSPSLCWYSSSRSGRFVIGASSKVAWGAPCTRAVNGLRLSPSVRSCSVFVIDDEATRFARGSSSFRASLPHSSKRLANPRDGSGHIDALSASYVLPERDGTQRATVEAALCCVGVASASILSAASASGRCFRGREPTARGQADPLSGAQPNLGAE
jgi:hypothetical protein